VDWKLRRFNRRPRPPTKKTRRRRIENYTTITIIYYSSSSAPPPSFLCLFHILSVNGDGQLQPVQQPWPAGNDLHIRIFISP
jgi:hypothetical protein